MATITATQARKDFFNLIKGANAKHEIYRINYKGGGAVLMSESEFESMQETLELLTIPGFRERFSKAAEEVAAGDTVSFEEVFGEPQ